ncbi:MAG: M48 family metalloprotease [Anaerohalosphaeraceae bacterium]|nr:M48 family metalloprotease [Anaerohalosphaeraceae bacterium]
MKKTIAIIISVCLLGLFASGCQVNPVTGEDEFNLFSPGQQKEMGAQYARQVEKELGQSVSDPQIQNYIDDIGQKIAAVCHTPSEGFIYKAIKDDSVNAFALPGGYIYITTGMLGQLQNESQLAAILAHETAHVTARHSAVTMSKEMLIGAGLSVLSPESKTISYAVGFVRNLESMRYSRSHERQADKIGLDYLVRAGYSPNGMVETMEILNRQPGGRTFEFLSTHPNPENRIEYIREDIYNKGYTKYKATGKIGIDDYQTNISARL